MFSMDIPITLYIGVKLYQSEFRIYVFFGMILNMDRLSPLGSFYNFM